MQFGILSILLWSASLIFHYMQAEHIWFFFRLFSVTPWVAFVINFLPHISKFFNHVAANLLRMQNHMSDLLLQHSCVQRVYNFKTRYFHSLSWLVWLCSHPSQVHITLIFYNFSGLFYCPPYRFFLFIHLTKLIFILEYIYSFILVKNVTKSSNSKWVLQYQSLF